MFLNSPFVGEIDMHQSIWSGSLTDVLIIPACIILNDHVALTWAAPGLENANPLLFIKGQILPWLSLSHRSWYSVSNLPYDNSLPKLQVIGLIVLNESSHPKAKSTIAAHPLMAELSNSNRDKPRLRQTYEELFQNFSTIFVPANVGTGSVTRNSDTENIDVNIHLLGSLINVGLGYLVAKPMEPNFRFPILTPLNRLLCSLRSPAGRSIQHCSLMQKESFHHVQKFGRRDVCKMFRTIPNSEPRLRLRMCRWCMCIRLL